METDRLITPDLEMNNSRLWVVRKVFKIRNFIMDFMIRSDVAVPYERLKNEYPKEIRKELRSDMRKYMRAKRMAAGRI
jgi:hypothetical protein